MKIMSIAGARPNFMKLASIADAIQKYNLGTSDYFQEEIEHIIVHTGQHYDERMSKTFFTDLAIPKPHFNLEVGSASHAQQTAEIMKRFEKVLVENLPSVLLVVGDVNSTIACALVASKIEYPAYHPLKRPIIVHVEAGLRSFDRTMPEEINRILTDALSDLLFVTEQSGIENLQKEGCDASKVHFVGNVMIDTLKRHLHAAKQSSVPKGLEGNAPYGLVTLHRPSNVDHPDKLRRIIECLRKISEDIQLIFPIHPRTKNKLEEFGLASVLSDTQNITVLQPLGYIEFLGMVSRSTLLLTDSGGIQEETTFLRVPCITLRENTERPVTVSEGSNYLTGLETDKILETVELLLQGRGKKASVPKYWDGRAGERIIRIIVEAFSRESMR